MILASGARGPGFNSRSSPLHPGAHAISASAAGSDIAEHSGRQVHRRTQNHCLSCRHGKLLPASSQVLPTPATCLSANAAKTTECLQLMMHCVAASELCHMAASTIEPETSNCTKEANNSTQHSSTLCPSGLRGWTQVPLAQAAWVQIPQVSFQFDISPSPNPKNLPIGQNTCQAIRLFAPARSYCKLCRIVNTARN